MGTSENFLALLGRVLMAVLFLQSGFYRLLTPTEAQEMIRNVGLPNEQIIYWITVAVEMIGGFALLLGIAQRLAAYVLAALVTLSAITFHTRFSDSAALTVFMKNDAFVHFMKNLAIAGGLLQIAVFGGDRHE